MTAFTHNTMWSLRDAVRTLYVRRKQLGQFVMTHEEYVNTFVPPEARPLFTDISTYITTNAQSNKFKLNTSDGDTQAYLHMHEIPGIEPLPIVRTLTIQPDAPLEVIERLAYWTANGGDPSREFGRVLKVLEMLNQHCTRSAVRFYWPTIIALLSVNESTKQLAKDLQELRMPSKLTPISRELQHACRVTAETISNAMLIPHDVQAYDKAPVEIEIKTGQSYEEPFAKFYGIT